MKLGLVKIVHIDNFTSFLQLFGSFSMYLRKSKDVLNKVPIR